MVVWSAGFITCTCRSFYCRRLVFLNRTSHTEPMEISLSLHHNSIMKSKAPLPFLLLLILVPILVTSAEASALATDQSAAPLHRRHLDGKKGCPSGTIEIPDGSDGYCQCCSKANERICLKMIVQCSNSSDGGNCCNNSDHICKHIEFHQTTRTRWAPQTSLALF